MKTLKVIGGAFLFLLFMTGTGFADTDQKKFEKAKQQLESLKSELTKSKITFDSKIEALIKAPAPSNVTDIKEIHQLIKSLERELQRITPTRSCIDDQPFEAETECPFYVHFYSAAEFIGSNEFGESFARGGIQLRSTLWEGELWTQQRFNFMVDLALTSRVVQTQIGPSIFETVGVKALEARMGFMLDLWNPVTNFTGDQSYSTTNTMALLVDIGFDSVEDLPAGSGAEINGPSDLLQHHFAGLRFYHRGINRFNGAYADIGWGISENFLENESKRFKVRGYLPILINKKTQFKLVAMIEVDSDFTDGPDETKLIVGATIAPEAFFRIPGMGWVTDLLDAE